MDYFKSELEPKVSIRLFTNHTNAYIDSKISLKRTPTAVSYIDLN